MQDCVFCKIVNREIPSDVIYEDDSVIVFLDIHPIQPGHALVVPKKHYQDFVSCHEADAATVIKVAQKIAPSIIKTVNASAFVLTTANGLEAGQSVFHLHFHIIPRFKKADLQDWPEQSSEPKSRKEIAEAIRKQL